MSRSSEVASLVADVFEAAGALRRLGEAEAAQAGQTQSRWQVLSVVAGEGTWTVPRAARRLGVTRQGVQRTVDALVRDGLLQAVHNPDHARSPLLRLTKEGESVLSQISAVADVWHGRAARRLDAEAVRTTRQTLAALTAIAREPEALADRPSRPGERSSAGRAP